MAEVSQPLFGEIQWGGRRLPGGDCSDQDDGALPACSIGNWKEKYLVPCLEPESHPGDPV